jgi:hypothetical protein
MGEGGSMQCDGWGNIQDKADRGMSEEAIEKPKSEIEIYRDRGMGWRGEGRSLSVPPYLFYASIALLYRAFQYISG